jgi:D-beta-D-heptose 7-phosphate kinase/D-beta-D-heptose 1-phosphate adenosyltransferase
MPEELVHILENLGKPRIMVVGDMMVDRYVWGNVDRISPEAPIQVLSVTNEESKLGGAASVVNNLFVLGARVLACGVVGDDSPGAAFRQSLRKMGLVDAGILVSPGRRTTVKTRMIARKQQVLRVDREDTEELPAGTVARVARFVEKHVRRTDLIVLSDYAKGLVTPGLVARIARAAKRAGVPVIADTAKQSDYAKYRGLTAITPNRSESELATGLRILSLADARAAAAKLLARLDLDAVVMTLDRDGIALLERPAKFTHVPTRPRAVYDVTGAGDMVISVVAMVLAAGHGYVEAAQLANVAAGLEVMRVGVQPLSRDEIIRAIRHEHAIAADKMIAPRELRRILDEHRRRRERIVFTNGCFDILHLGHAKYLEFARGLGDVLVVGVNSDRSVRKIKGPHRPICSESERAQMLAALGDVSYVVLFDEPTPEKLIRRVRPDVLVKGEDWKEKGVVGSEFVKSSGGEVVLAPLVKGKSTTDIIARILQIGPKALDSSRGGTKKT